MADSSEGAALSQAKANAKAQPLTSPSFVEQRAELAGQGRLIREQVGL